MKIGERIKLRREELKMSQDELAQKLGYKSRSSINKIERDASGLPQKKIKDIAIALNTTPAYIMGWTEVTKKADILTDAVLRAKTDKEFEILIEKIVQMDSKQVERLLAFLNAFSQ